MHIVADENIPLLEPFFGALGTIERVNGRKLGRDQLRAADVLLVRSVTRVDRALLSGTPVRFVGTATIGTDHVDTGWLGEQGIAFAAAPGCNAGSVVQYVLAVLCLHLARTAGSLEELTVGVIGAGNVGGLLVEQLMALGVEVRVSDPPRQQNDETLPYAPLEAVLQCDVVTLHTPLVTTGPHPTHHLLDQTRLAGLGSHQLVINSGRGPVIDNNALLERLRQPDAPHVALDVWETEPEPIVELIERCWLATPHIAGYSLEGKCRGTEMLARALHQWLKRPMRATLEGLLPPPPVRSLGLTAEQPPLDALRRALLVGYDPRDDDNRFRAMTGAAVNLRRSLGKGFDDLRRAYPVRREPGSLTVQLPSGSPLASLLGHAGFTIG